MTHKTSLTDRLQQVMTESRMIVPGAQALLGFQFATVFTDAVARLTPPVKAIHVAGMCAIALAAILLIAPASFHRIAENGEDAERVVAVGSRFVLLSLIPLAIGVALDVAVVVLQSGIRSAVAIGLPIGMLLASFAVWFMFPMLDRRRRR